LAFFRNKTTNKIVFAVSFILLLFLFLNFLFRLQQFYKKSNGQKAPFVAEFVFEFLVFDSKCEKTIFASSNLPKNFLDFSRISPHTDYFRLV
jgi:hypothetical protein